MDTSHPTPSRAQLGLQQEEIAANVRILIALHRTNANALAIRMGITPPILSRRMSGIHRFTIRSLGHIGQALDLGCAPDFLHMVNLKVLIASAIQNFQDDSNGPSDEIDPDKARDNIRILIAWADQTISTLAKKTGITVSRASRLLSGVTRLKPRHLATFGNGLKIPANFLQEVDLASLIESAMDPFRKPPTNA